MVQRATNKLLRNNDTASATGNYISHCPFLYAYRLVLLAELGNTRECLTLQELEGSASTSADMRDLALITELSNDGSCIATTDDDSRTVLYGLLSGSKELLGTFSEGRELEDTGRAVPQDGLRLEDSLLEELARFGAGIETHPAVGDALRVGSSASLRGIRS